MSVRRHAIARGLGGRAAQHVIAKSSQESVNYILSSKELGSALSAA
jgi:hypothetical protein